MSQSTRAARALPKGLQVVFEDASIVVIDKPAGLLTMATDREDERTAYAAMTRYVRKGQARSRERVFIVHRLDRDTSGLLVLARTPEAKRALQDGWADVQKLYHAVVWGRPNGEEGEMVDWLGQNESLRVFVTRDQTHGYRSVTGWRLLEAGPYRSLLELDLRTGRRHQIRVQLASRGCPVLGDPAYGREKGRDASRLALHATSIAFPHPVTCEPLRFESPAPPVFTTWARSQAETVRSRSVRPSRARGAKVPGGK